MISIHVQQTQNGFAIGWITLDLPQTLNALTLDMVTTAYKQLLIWRDEAHIACVVLQGTGRAFCAGGDVRRMRQGIIAGDSYCAQFFEMEYRLDHAIHYYPKPVLAWGHGVVMGGGLGLFIGASHRVVTESTRLAMPEINIGLYPDVGASYFLNKLPEGLGLFLGITGCEWNGADALALDIADFLLNDQHKDHLPTLLEHLIWTSDTTANSQLLTQALGALPTAVVDTRLLHYTNMIQPACQGSLMEVATAIQTLDIREPWFEQAMNNLAHGCPVSACIVFEQLQRGQGVSLADVLRMEWNISLQCCRHPDFPEGVRAQLVDKDKKPRWQFPGIREIADSYITGHFLPLDIENPLGNLD